MLSFFSFFSFFDAYFIKIFYYRLQFITNQKASWNKKEENRPHLDDFHNIYKV